jgi:hypothetical protein
VAPSNEGSLLISVVILRRVVGFIGLLLSPVLVVSSGLHLQSSISDYYYTGAQNIFVGALCAVGVFLCCYKGFDVNDWVLSLIAGSAAILVALCPTVPANPTTLEALKGDLHWLFAATFLGSLAYLSLFQFTKTNAPGNPTPQKLARNRVYRVCGALMAGCLLLLLAYKLSPPGLTQGLARFNPVFCLESVAVIAFGVSWLTKGEMLLGDKPQTADPA